MGKISAMFAKGKGVVGTALKEGVMPVGLIGTGMIVSAKFLDFKTILPNVDPNKWFIKHEGGIKFGAAIISLAVFKKLPPWAKFLIWGVAAQGFVKEIKVLTTNAEGKSFIDNIAGGAYDTEIKEAAEKINSLSDQFQTNVSGENEEGGGVGKLNRDAMKNPVVNLLQQNSNTGVSGMGMGDLYGAENPYAA